MKKSHLPILLLLASLLSVAAQSVPPLVNYQGRLSNPDGSPLPTADYTLTFNLYDAATNGVRVWGPQIFDGVAAQGHGARIPVVQGYFNVMLGPVDTNGVALSDAFNGTSRYVEITISNRPPIAPRQQILTTPFAFQAANSAKLAGYDWSALLGTNDPTVGTIPFSKLPPRQIGTNVAVGGVAVSPILVRADLSPGTTWTDVPTLELTIATTGRPVMVTLAATNGPGGGHVYLSTGSRNDGGMQLLRNGNAVNNSFMGIPVGTSLFLPASAVQFIDFAPLGIHTYRLQVSGGGTGFGQFIFENIRLIAFEL